MRRDYITSLDHREPEHNAARFGQLIRDHWRIENKLHWSLAVTFGEDDSRIRQGHSQETLSRMRRMALNLLKQEKPANEVSHANACSPAGTATTSSRYSASQIRCDRPGLLRDKFEFLDAAA